MARQLDRVNLFLERMSRRRRVIATPEGVELEVLLANAGERLTAFGIDMFFWLAATLLLYLILVLMLIGHLGFMLGLSVISFLAFLLRNLYFIAFEHRSNGRTPGKRIAGLRVIDRRGGPLTAGAVFSRNLTREVEVFLPLGAYFVLKANGGSLGFWAGLAYLGWMVLLSALPLFTRDRQRAGDLIGGTLVIHVPKRSLLAELTEGERRFDFSRKQLDVYGAFELQVLEEVLRRPNSAETDAVMSDICRKVIRKIGWTGKLKSNWTGKVPPEEGRAFLTAFYTAQRAHLEREQLFGRPRPEKSA